MSAAASSPYCTTLSSPSSILHRRRISPKPISPFLRSTTNSTRRTSIFASSSSSSSSSAGDINKNDKNKNKNKKDAVEKVVEAEEVEVEEDLPWIQEKALDLVEYTGSVTQAIPGPRVGQTSFPWILAVPLAYVGVTFVFALVKTIRKFKSPKELRRKLVNKNAVLCKSVDELLEKKSNGVQPLALMELMKQTGFTMEEILRKYIRYALNEKPFNPDLIANLIQLRKASMLEDSQVAQTLNEISRRIVKDKGPVVMNVSGYSEKGFKRKLAVQALFGKIFYLSELPDFCSKESTLIVKEIFGVADEDAEKLRMHTVSEAGDMASLEKMVDNSDPNDSGDGSSPAAPDSTAQT